MSDSPDASHDQAPEEPGDGIPAAPATPPVIETDPPAPQAEESAGSRAHWTLAGASWLRWALALVVVAAGIAASVLGARAVARSDAEDARTSFKHGAAGAAGAVKLALAHQEGVLTASGTYLSRNPGGSTAEFKTWAGWAHVLRNHPELESLSLIALVRAPELPAFHARLAGVPYKPPAAVITKTATGATHTVSAAAAAAAAAAALPKVSPNGRSYECLPIGTVGRNAASQPAASFDLCSADRALLKTRDSGRSQFVTVSTDGGSTLEVLTPLYRGSVLPKTDLGRRAAFAGWVREVLDPQVLLSESMHGLPEGAARLRHRSHGSTSLFTLGSVPPGALTSAAGFRGGWSLRTFAPKPSAAIGDHADAIALLVTGIIASLLAGALVLGLRRRGPAAAAPGASQDAPQPREELYDPLTGLPNRALTMDRAERMLARAGRNSAIMIGALFIDIDWFKDVNDKLGEEAGDQLLKTVAERLDGVVRTHDTVGRYGGDEFVVIVESQVKGMRLDSLARRIIESLHKPVDLEGFGPSFVLTASIGVAFGRYATPDDLLRDAHMALFAAKAAGKDRYTLFNANMRAIIEGRGVLEVELNNALQENQFSLHYQPIYDLQTHQVVGLESLLRWEHPTRGEVPVSDFVPLAEESGLIVPIGRWVLEQACTRAAGWNVSGHRVGVAVKVAAAQLDRDGFVTDVLRALQQSGLEPSLLALEIAETTVMADKQAVSQRIAQLKQLGVRIAIDDFGSGYAYRADLQQMPIDFLKVDRASLAASEDEDYRSWLLEAILVFGRDLALTVIAKGVEDQEQMLALQAMGCTMAQGFYLGGPVASDAVETLFGVQAPAAPADPVADPQP